LTNDKFVIYGASHHLGGTGKRDARTIGRPPQLLGRRGDAKQGGLLMTISATVAERKALSVELGDALATIESQAFEVLSEGEIGTTEEYLNCDRYDMEVTLLSAARAFSAILATHRAERTRLASDHDEIEHEQATIERMNAGLGYGHLQREMV
jgi:hypothetical protein